jgi:hypothetical protein
MKKWLIGIIIVLVLGILMMALIPRDLFNSILFDLQNIIMRHEQNKIVSKEAEVKGIEQTVKGLLEQNARQAKTIEQLRTQRAQIKPTKDTQELKRAFAQLGYPPK